MTAELVLDASPAVVGRGGLIYGCPVPHIPESVGVVRRRVGSLLREWGVSEDTADAVVLVVSELVTNAVVHARPPAELRLSYDRRLRVEVRDSGPVEADGLGCADDEHGRGCGIVLFLAAGCGAYQDGPRSVRWAEFDVPDVPPVRPL